MSRQGNYVTVPNVGGNNALSGLSSSLTDLATLMHNRNISEQAQEQWEAEQAQKRAELSSRNSQWRDTHELAKQQEDRAQAEHQATVDKRVALGDVNARIAGGLVDDTEFTIGRLPRYLADRLTADQNNLTEGKEEFLAFANGDLSDESVETAVQNYNKRFAPKALTVSDVESADRRLGVYKAFAADLKAAKTPEERAALIDRAVNTMFDGELARLHGDIKSGIYLTKEEKINALIGALPEKTIRAIGDRATLLGEFEGAVRGMSRDEIVAREAAAVNAYNTSLKASINKARKAHKPGNAYTAKDVTNHLKTIQGIDVGILDNKKVRAASDAMLQAGIHPAAISVAISNTIAENTNLVGKSFVVNGDEGYARMVARARELSDYITGKSDNADVITGYTPAINRTVPQLRMRMLSNYRAGRLGELYKPQAATTPKPTPSTAAGTAPKSSHGLAVELARRIVDNQAFDAFYPSYNPFDTSDVPRSEQYTPSPEEMAYLAKRDAHYKDKAYNEAVNTSLPGVAANVVGTYLGRLPAAPAYAVGAIQDFIDSRTNGKDTGKRFDYAESATILQPDEDSSSSHRKAVDTIDRALFAATAVAPLRPVRTLLLNGSALRTAHQATKATKATPKSSLEIARAKLAAANPNKVSDVRLSSVPAMYRADMAKLQKWLETRAVLTPKR